MQTVELTRFSQSLAAMFQDGRRDTTGGRLVRIYPATGVGQVFDLAEGRVFVGRELDCDLHLADDTVSRQHATIERFDRDYAVTDLGSTNGTYVNEERIESRWLAPGDRVRFGNQIFKFLSADQMEAQYHEAVFRIITTDGLTQLYNKRYLMDVLDREVHRAMRTGTPLCVVMFDVDQFKSVNDNFGHLTGDEVLSELASRAQSLLRQDEVLARFGGEEFVLLLADTTLTKAQEVAERLRRKIAESPMRTEVAEIPITISLGIAEMNAERPVTGLQLLEQADRQLYRAKQSGRNCVMT